MTARRRVARPGGLLLAALVAVALLGACESGVSKAERADIAAQDRAAEGANRLDAQHAAKLKAALRERWTQRAKVRRAARRHRPRVVISSRSDVGDLCAPIRAGVPGPLGRAERKARRLRRKQVLGYLNLSCPSLNIPRV